MHRQVRHARRGGRRAPPLEWRFTLKSEAAAHQRAKIHSGRDMKALLLLPSAALLTAAKPAPLPPPMPSLVAPAEVAANKANHLFLQLSTGGTVEVVLRPDLAPHHVERIQT